jgi:hypothetical protein
MRKSIVLLLALSGCATSTPGAGSTPWKGKAAVIPGVVEAEHYDEGPAGVAYADTDDQNEGAKEFRGETGVDIEPRPDASGKHGIGWTRAGEWLVYTVEIRESGTYSIDIPVASNKQGGVFHLEFDGVDKTGPIAVPDTGGWKILKMITHPGVKLEAGVRKMRAVMDSVGPSRSIADIDLFHFKKTGP